MEAINSIKNIFNNLKDKEEKKRSFSSDAYKEKNKKETQTNNNREDNVKRKTLKYKKRFDPIKNDFNTKIHYIEIMDKNSNIYKYSMNKAYEKTLKVTYYCSDTLCEGRITVQYEETKGSGNDKNYIFKNFNETKEHSLIYEMHKYVRKQAIKNDINELSKNNIIKKCKDYKYCKDFVKEIAIKNRLFNTKPSILKKFIISNYGNVILNYNLISTNEKNKLINIYKTIKLMQPQK